MSRPASDSPHFDRQVRELLDGPSADLDRFADDVTWYLPEGSQDLVWVPREAKPWHTKA